MSAPFLRWVGGKNDHLELLLRHVPKKRPMPYLEAFVGGGALFFELVRLGLVTRATLADSNDRLMRCYRAVRDEPSRVATLVERWPVSRDFFFRAREWQVDAGHDVEVAAWLLYVNHAGYGGMYRVNARGRFNTSYDEDRDGRPWSGRERLLAASQALRGVELVTGDFAEVLLAHARRGTLTFLDPPYLRARPGDFTSYQRRGFGPREHALLAQQAAQARASGARVLATNSSAAAPLWRGAGFRVELLDGRRMIGRKFGASAPRAAEMIAVG